MNGSATGPERGLTKADRDNLARLARQRARVAKQLVAERQKAVLADVEDQLSATYQASEEAWAHITRQAKAEVAKADAQIAEICRSWGVPEEFRPGLSLQWYSRGTNAEASRRSELRKLAQARVEAAAQSAKTTIDAKLLDVETALIRDGLDSAEAHRWLESMPSPDELMPRLDVGELEGNPERQPWVPDPELTRDVLTPSNGRSREARRQAIARALSANPSGSNREIARMAGVDHKTVAATRGEIPTTDGEIPEAGP